MDQTQNLIEESSGNVFADLGLSSPAEHLSKAKLVRALGEVLKSKGLTQVEAAAIIGLDQPSISKLLRGQFRGFSTDRLLHFLNLLGQDVEITIVPGRASEGEIRVALSS